LQQKAPIDFPFEIKYSVQSKLVILLKNSDSRLQASYLGIQNPKSSDANKFQKRICLFLQSKKNLRNTKSGVTPSIVQPVCVAQQIVASQWIGTQAILK
jgi:hypothetical protein